MPFTNKEKFLNSCIVLDTETNNIDYNVAEVIELGISRYRRNGDFTELGWDSESYLHKPSVLVKPEISAVTNITNKMLVGCEPFENSLEDYQYDVSCAKVAVAHNAVYDMNVLKNAGLEAPVWLDTLRLAKKLYANDKTVEQYNLPYLRYRFDILDPADYPEVESHRAGDDAMVTGHLLEKLVTEMETRGLITLDIDYYPQIEDFLSMPIKMLHMPFGKWKGAEFKHIPISYWKWALVNMDCFDTSSPNYDIDLSYSVELSLEGKF